MQKKAGKSKISQEELKERLQRMEARKELERVKHEMETGVSHSSPAKKSDLPIENLLGVGQNDESIYEECRRELFNLLNKIGDFAFSPDRSEMLFPKDKIVHIVNTLRKSKMEMEARSVMDIFKDRVKVKNQGVLPKIKEKQGMFGKTVSRPMRIEEIAAKFTIEDSLPPDDAGKPGEKGTKAGLMQHLNSILLATDEVMDPLKPGPRRLIALFLDNAGLINLRSTDPNQKYFTAVLLTPDSMQPHNRTDRDRFIKLRALLQKANKWMDDQLKAKGEQAKTEESKEPAAATGSG